MWWRKYSGVTSGSWKSDGCPARGLVRATIRSGPTGRMLSSDSRSGCLAVRWIALKVGPRVSDSNCSRRRSPEFGRTVSPPALPSRAKTSGKTFRALQLSGFSPFRPSVELRSHECFASSESFIPAVDAYTRNRLRMHVASGREKTLSSRRTTALRIYFYFNGFSLLISPFFPLFFWLFVDFR